MLYLEAGIAYSDVNDCYSSKLHVSVHFYDVTLYWHGACYGTASVCLLVTSWYFVKMVNCRFTQKISHSACQRSL